MYIYIKLHTPLLYEINIMVLLTFEMSLYYLSRLTFIFLNQIHTFVKKFLGKILIKYLRLLKHDFIGLYLQFFL